MHAFNPEIPRSRQIDAALERARSDRFRHSLVGPDLGEPDGHPRTRIIAMGDAQAPFLKVLQILDHHDLLADTGRIRPDVRLILVGDYFDYGPPGDRTLAANDALHLLSWLSAHPSDQVILILGNHDLARVGELNAFDDARFERAYADALELWPKSHPDPERATLFLQSYPELPGPRIVARDYSSYLQEQRDLLIALFQARRVQLAYAPDPRILLSHAAVTEADLYLLGVPPSEQNHAQAIEQALADWLEEALAAWDQTQALNLAPLHSPGSAAVGEGHGILYHRPGHPDCGASHAFEGRRRFDPRTLPKGLVQAIGHTRDQKCRHLLGPWVADQRAAEGELRHALVDAHSVQYARGIPEALDAQICAHPEQAALLFLDGGMNHAAKERYQMLDVATRRAWVTQK